MAQVPMRMPQPGLIPHHQQRPPMMVSMTQPPPPVSIQGLVSMAPIMGPGGGMAVMTQAMNHPDSPHDHHHHHAINSPYHPHHHHHHHQPPPHLGPPRPHAPPPPPPQGHLQGPPHSAPMHHPNGPPHSASATAPPPPHSQYLPAGPMHAPIHGHSAHNALHSGSHSGPLNNSGAAHSNHTPSQNQAIVGAPNIPQPMHSSSNHQVSGRNNSNLNMGQQSHQNLPPSQQISQQSRQHFHRSQQQPIHQQISHNVQQNPQMQPIQHHSQYSEQTSQNSSSTHHNVEKSTSGVIILNSNNSVTNGPLNVNISSNLTASSSLSTSMVNGMVSPSSSNGCDINSHLSTREKTPMCLINELARFNKIQHQYCLTDEKGPAHKKIFTVSLHLGDEEEEYSASGQSIKKAQHSAAALALEKTKFKHPPLKTQKMNKQTKLTPTVELNALAMKRGEAAIYTFMETPRSPNPYPFNFPPNLRAIYNQKYYGRGPPLCPMFFVSLRVGSKEFVGEGTTAQQAKHNAASKALKVVKSLALPDSSSPNNNPVPPDLSELDPNADLKSPISLVHEIALKRRLTVNFEVVRESGPPHMRMFVATCVVGDVRTQAEGTGKKVSKKRAAELMLDELRKLPPVSTTPVPTRTKRKPTTKKKSRNLIKEQKAAPEYGQGINPISRLIQIQQAKKEKEPAYTLLAERGVPRRREFVMQVTIGVQSTQGSGPNKKLAKRAAAESMLQLLGYSRPQPQPGKPAIKMENSHSDSDKTRKSVTFLEEPSESAHVSNNHETNHNSMSSSHSFASGGGRQLVPGLIMMPDGSSLHGYQPMQQNGMKKMVNMNPMVNIKTTAAIAKELLESGNSPTANTISNKKQVTPSIPNQQNSHPHNMGVPQNVIHQPPQPHLPSQPLQQPQIHARPLEQQPQAAQQQQPNSQPIQQPGPTSPQPPQMKAQQHQPQVQVQANTGSSSMSNNINSSPLMISGNTSSQAVRPKEQLMYLANILNIQVQFTDFPKGNNKSGFMSLVSLSTNPPHMSHGAGPTIEASQDQACLTALRELAEMGIDSVTSADPDSAKS